MQLAWTRKLENLTKVHMANLRVLIQLLFVRDFQRMGEVEGGVQHTGGKQVSTPRYFIDCHPAARRPAGRSSTSLTLQLEANRF